MRTIQVIIRDWNGTESTREIGTNERDGGLFVRDSSGSWSQFAGNGQTPTFRNAAHMMQYLRTNHYTTPGEIRMVRGSGF